MKYLALLCLCSCAASQPSLLSVHTDDPRLRPNMLLAADTWNQALDFDAVVEGPQVELKIMPEDWDTDALGAYTKEDKTIAIRLGTGLNVYVHEIGHALGLQHDSLRGSVMNEKPPGLWRITDEDVQRLTDSNP